MESENLLLGFVAGIPQVRLDPDLIFLVVLPPLLYAAAWGTSWRDFRYNFVSIFLLAFARSDSQLPRLPWLRPGFSGGLTGALV